MTRLTARVPAALDSVRTMLLCPLAALLAVGLCVDALAPVFGGGGQWFSGLLGSLDGAAAVLLGCVLGAMMNVDFGGPVNKSAYLFGTAALAAGSGRVMAAVMIGGMVPPFATALAAALFPSAFDERERCHGRTNWMLGACFIS